MTNLQLNGEYFLPNVTISSPFELASSEHKSREFISSLLCLGVSERERFKEAGKNK